MYVHCKFKCHICKHSTALQHSRGLTNGMVYEMNHMIIASLDNWGLSICITS